MTWTHVSDGDVSISSTVNQPPGKQIGDLLVVPTGCRGGAGTLSGIDPAKWTVLASSASGYDNQSMRVFARYATGDADDTFSPNWSSGQPASQILCFRGPFVPLAEILLGTPAIFGSTSGQGHIPVNALAVPEDNGLVIFMGKKQKSNSTNGATLTDPAGLANRSGFIWPDGDFGMGFVTGYTIQTAAEDIAAGQWTQSATEGGMQAGSIVLALKTAEASPAGAVLPMIDTDGVVGHQLINGGLIT